MALTYPSSGYPVGYSSQNGFPLGNGNVFPTGGAGVGSTPQSYAVYNDAVKANADDYNKITQNYSDIFQKAMNPPQVQNYNAQTTNYTNDPEFQAAKQGLGNTAQTGGYSSQDIADLRARDVGPIRSIYASAQQNLDRQKSLQGGYSPNYTAATARTARDESDQIGSAVTNANASIANQVASNKAAASAQYADLLAKQNAQQNEFAANNANIKNDASKFNIGNQIQNGQYYNGLALNANQGMAGIYGSTPGLSRTFGDQALGNATLQNNINQQNKNGNLQLISSLVNGGRF